MKRIALTVVLTILANLVLAQATLAQTSTCITSNFNGTSIAPGRYIWFNSNLDVSGITGPTTVTLTNASLNIGGTTYQIPNARITYDPSVTVPSTFFNSATFTWETVVPANAGDEVFLTGLPIFLPNGLAGGQSPVIFCGTFNSNPLCGISGSFKFGAAAYTQMPSDPNQLGVKVTHSYGGSHHAGTPENYTQFVIGGARGGGGSNFTGSWSSTGHFTAGCTTPTPTPMMTPTPTPTATPMTPTPTPMTPTPTPPEMTPTPTPPGMTPTPTPPSVPEPMTIILFGTGLASLGFAARKRLGRKDREADGDKEQ